MPSFKSQFPAELREEPGSNSWRRPFSRPYAINAILAHEQARHQVTAAGACVPIGRAQGPALVEGAGDSSVGILFRQGYGGQVASTCPP